MSLLFKITYGLYVVSASDDNQHNACICNTLMQQSDSPQRLSLTLNKDNLTTDLIAKSGKCSVGVLSQNTTFDLIKDFGMQSGRNVDKFANAEFYVTENGNKLPAGDIGHFDFDVLDTVDFGTHTMFVLAPTDMVVSKADENPLTYAYYHSDVKPKPQAQVSNSESWVCKICNYVHNGPLPSDIICPLCKHGAVDFVKVEK